ncbi:hypothetical protein PHYPSEUDO_004312 [Phytophthora pseudosyringae]|uniref:Uncharacterized protein n=1 Tax=Phytophthora pseudosyringae TaxID=221518 RepID=A0A8T1VTI7_9STRA|nr:hypothetical protein PHYPSEUDO_004312 [Phytophthora pseudosyringae]
MSFLVCDDDLTVVEEALAFIDSCGTDLNSEGDRSADAQASSEKSIGTRGRDASAAQQTRRPQTKPKAKKRRIKTFASSVCDLWKDLQTVHEIPGKRYRYVSPSAALRGSKPNTLEKNFVMTLRGQQSDIEINGNQFSRKFDEAQRIVIAKADSIILPTQGLEFRSPWWTTIPASESDPQHASVVRSYLRIYAEVQPDISARREDVDCARSFVLNGLSKMMYGCAQKTQSELIQQALVIYFK